MVTAIKPVLRKTAAKYDRRYRKGVVLVRIKDGEEFVVVEDVGLGIKFKGYPDSLFDRSFFRPK